VGGVSWLQKSQLIIRASQLPELAAPAPDDAVASYLEKDSADALINSPGAGYLSS